MNGISVADLATIVQHKDKSMGKIMFTPIDIEHQEAVGKPLTPFYQNVSVGWADSDGAKLVATLINALAITATA
jgi:hypothetical protein